MRVLAGPRLLVTVGVVAVAICAAASLRGQAGAAQADYREGEALYEQGDLAGALHAFQRAYAVDPNSHRGDRIGMHFEEYDPAFQIGRVYARLGEFDLAERYFSLCAASGYTLRSENSQEFLRWRAVVNRALASARQRPSPSSTAAPSPSPTPTPWPTPNPIAGRATGAAFGSGGPLSTTAGPAAVQPVAHATPETRPPAPKPRAVPSPRAAVMATPVGIPEALPRARGPESRPNSSPLNPSLLFVGVVIVAAAFGAGAWIRLRSWRRERGVVLGRYRVSGFVGAGSNSFVYEAHDRRTGAPAVLRVLRPQANGESARRFRQEASALETVRRSRIPVAVPGLLEHGFANGRHGKTEYLALERLSGRTLLDICRNGRRRLKPEVRVRVALAVARVLEQGRRAGLRHPEMTSEDVFVVGSLGASARSPVDLRILGFIEGDSDPRSQIEALREVLIELFRNRASRPGAEEDVARDLPDLLQPFIPRLATDSDPSAVLRRFQEALESSAAAPFVND